MFCTSFAGFRIIYLLHLFSSLIKFAPPLTHLCRAIIYPVSEPSLYALRSLAVAEKQRLQNINLESERQSVQGPSSVGGQCDPATGTCSFTFDQKKEQ